MSDDQRDQMKAMTLDKERAEYLIDNVIITSLKVDAREPFYDFLQVLEDGDNAVVKAVARDLRSQLEQSLQSFQTLPFQTLPFPQLCKSKAILLRNQTVKDNSMLANTRGAMTYLALQIIQGGKVLWFSRID